MSAYYYGIIEAGLGFYAKLPFIVLSQSPFIVLGSDTDEFHREFPTEAAARQFVSETRLKSPHSTLRLYGHADGRWRLLDSAFPASTKDGGSPQATRKTAGNRQSRTQIRATQGAAPVFNVRIESQVPA